MVKRKKGKKEEKDELGTKVASNVSTGSLASTLRAYREACNYSQRQLGGLADVSALYISQIETGRRNNPSLSVVKRFAQAMRLSSSERDKLYAAAGYRYRDCVSYFSGESIGLTMPATELQVVWRTCVLNRIMYDCRLSSDQRASLLDYIIVYAQRKSEEMLTSRLPR